MQQYARRVENCAKKAKSKTPEGMMSSQHWCKEAHYWHIFTCKQSVYTPHGWPGTP